MAVSPPAHLGLVDGSPEPLGGADVVSHLQGFRRALEEQQEHEARIDELLGLIEAQIVPLLTETCVHRVPIREVLLEDGARERCWERVYLAVLSYHGKMLLAVKTYQERESFPSREIGRECVQIQRLRRAPRATRQAAMDHLPDLLRELDERTRADRAVAKERGRKAAEVLEQLRPAAPQPALPVSVPPPTPTRPAGEDRLDLRLGRLTLSLGYRLAPKA